MDFITVNNISKKHGDDFALQDISFTQATGHKIAIAGETGSGKSTLMRIVAGLGQADSGTVHFEGKQVKGIHEKLMPGHKGIAYLSQHFELPNNYRVTELLAYANDLTNEASSRLYSVCHIDHLLHRWTNTLSGGEKQRVAMARLLTLAPKLLLLDEPYSNLDFIHKQHLKNVVWDIGEKLGITCMLISHDPADMLSWADEVFVMQHGQIVQRGTPRNVYTHPHSDYAAGLLGKYNVLSQALATSLDIPANENIYIRPESLTIRTDNTNGVPAIVQRVLYMGGYTEVEVMTDGQLLTVKIDKSIPELKEVYVQRRK